MRREVRAHAHQAVRLGVGQGVEQDRLDHPEDGGVGADAQGQGHDRDRGEAGRPPELPQ